MTRWILPSLISIFLCVPLPGVGQERGDAAARAACLPYKSVALRQAADAMCGGQLLNAFATLVNQSFNLPKALLILGKECGQSNAFFQADTSSISVCYELGKEVSRRIVREVRSDANAQSEIAAGALFFIFAHELGHALISYYNLPVLGREEDAADQIATFLLIVIAAHKTEVARYWTVGAHWYFSRRPMLYKSGHFADEHSVNPQRQFNIACWIYGSDVNKYGGFARYAKLPAARAERCPAEYQQLLNAAKQMLSPYVKSAAATTQPEAAERRSSMAQRAMACQAEAQTQGLVGLERNGYLDDCYARNGVVVRNAR